MFRRVPSISTCRSGGCPRPARARPRPNACYSTRWFSRLPIPSLLPRGRPLKDPACSAPCRSCTRVTWPERRRGMVVAGLVRAARDHGSRSEPGFASTISVRQSLPPCRAAVSFWPGHCWFMMPSRRERLCRVVPSSWDMVSSKAHIPLARGARQRQASRTVRRLDYKGGGEELLFDEGASPPTSAQDRRERKCPPTRKQSFFGFRLRHQYNPTKMDPPRSNAYSGHLSARMFDSVRPSPKARC